ncbi:hypothetical protein SAMN05446635_8425 [Burkholderia sp. OK233]|nr:hypothetical protein SAMN05446635_8425 [Burkholderia sp. OK233]
MSDSSSSLTKMEWACPPFGDRDTEWTKFKAVDKRTYYPDWVVVINEIIEVFGKQRNLLAVFAF